MTIKLVRRFSNFPFHSPYLLPTSRKSPKIMKVLNTLQKFKIMQKPNHNEKNKGTKYSLGVKWHLVQFLYKKWDIKF